jgi:hypothetical protein
MDGAGRDMGAKRTRIPATAKRDVSNAVITRDAAAWERASRAVQMRTAAKTYDAIAQACGYAGPGAARKAIMREMQRVSVANVDQLRAEEDETLRVLHERVWQVAMGLDENGRPTKEPNLWAVDRVLAIREARRKLMGLDAVASDAGSIPVAREYVGVNVAGLVRPGGADA